MKYLLLLSSLLLACTNARAMDQQYDRAISQDSSIKDVPLLADLCKQYIIRNFKSYDRAGAFDITRASAQLPTNLQKTIVFGRAHYLNECVERLRYEFYKKTFEDEFFCNEARRNALSNNVKQVYQQCCALLIKHLPMLLHSTELTSQEAKAAVECSALFDQKSLLDYVTIFTSLPADAPCYLSNTAQLQAVCSKYALEKWALQSIQSVERSLPYQLYYNQETNLPVPHGNSRIFYANGKQVVVGVNINGIWCANLETHYALHDAADSEIERLVMDCVMRECKQLPIAYTQLHGHTICALPSYQTDEDNNIYELGIHLFIDGLYVDKITTNIETQNNIQQPTRVFFDEHGTHVLFANDQQTFSVRLPHYFSALIHNTFTWQELIYLIVLGRLDNVVIPGLSCEEEISENLLNTMRCHPMLENIKQKNTPFYHDLVAFLDNINKAPAPDSSANETEADDFFDDFFGPELE